MSWREQLTTAVRQSKARVVGLHDCENEAQADVVMAFLAAYDAQQAFFYIEPCLATSSHMPPDMVVLSPEVGVMVVEVKGWSINFIERINAGSFYLRSAGYPKPQNPFKQVQKATLNIRNAAEQLVEDMYDLPLFSYAIAFPNISEYDWVERGFDLALPQRQLLFKEQIEDVDHLKAYVTDLIDEGLQRSNKSHPCDSVQQLRIRQVFGDSVVINENRNERPDVSEDKLGAVLDDFATTEKYLSAEQQDLSRIELEGHPRLVRGVAGSGKTVVLANLVARYLKRRLGEQQNLFTENKPTPVRVGVICFNRSLISFLEKKIRLAFESFTELPLPEDCLYVRHFQSLLYDLSQQGYWNYQRVDEGRAAEQAKAYLEMWRDPVRLNDPPFDVIFIDEGQDIEPEQYQLLHELIKPDPMTGERNLMIFYDDAQNLYARLRPNWKSMGIDMQRGRSRVMRECFRNTQEIVNLALNVLIGTKAPEEFKVHTKGFADLAYLKNARLVEECETHLNAKFARRSYAQPTLHLFDTAEAERQWIASEVSKLILDEQVRSDDILILQGTTDGAKALATAIQQLLGKKLEGFIMPYKKGNPEDRDRYIFEPNHLTISTVHGAKGYDAPIVFLARSEAFAADDPENTGRAAFYVGATRAKHVLYISGVKQDKPNLLSEAMLVAESLWGEGD